MMLDLGLRQRPEEGRWTITQLKKHVTTNVNVKGRAFLPELGFFFGDHSNLQLSGPEVHIQDRGQA